MEACHGPSEHGRVLNMTTFRIWTDKFVHVTGSRYKGQSFVVEAETADEAISKVLAQIEPGHKIMAWTNLTTGESK